MYEKKLREFLQIFAVIVALLFITSFVHAQTLNDIISKEKSHPKIEGTLIRLQDKHKQSPAAALKFAQEKTLQVHDQDKIVVFIMAEPEKTADTIDRAALESYGAEIIKSAGGILQVKIPIEHITEIADNVKGISFIRLPDKPHSQHYQSEGVALTGAASFQSAGYTGAGIKVAVIDSGFSGLSSAIANGELPTTITVVDCTGANCASVPSPYNNLGTSGHGTAVAEIIYDMAPGCKLYLMYIATSADLITAKDYCIAQGIRIINHSVGWSNSNFSDGKCWPNLVNPVCTVDDAYAHDILWVNAAGNSAKRHYSATYVDLNNTGFHDQGITISANVGDTIKLYLTWDAWPYTDQDYNLGLADSSGNLVDYSVTSQTGIQPPIESISYAVPSKGSYIAVIQKYKATANHKLELYSVNHNITPSIAGGSIKSPADAANALAVGAIAYSQWMTGPIADYSSQGPTNDGRIKPDIAGPSSVSTYSYGPSGFSGTSSASPHVAGAAALILSKYPSLTAVQLWITLGVYAKDMDASGKDNIYGYGRLDMPCLNLPVRRASRSYSALQDAYNDAVDGDTIQSQAVFFYENLDFSQNISIAIMGGYDCSFSTNVQKSVVNGTVTIRNGTVTIENIIIR